MHLQPFRSSSSAHPAHNGALAHIVTQTLVRTHAIAVGAGFLVRFALLSVLACLLFTAPISLNEVPYASQRPTSGQ